METVVTKKKKIGRNDPCPCGSGKKYKRCCLHNSKAFPPQEQMSQLLRLIKDQQSPEPHLNLVKSAVWNGYRWRAIGNRLHYRPVEETLHEFIIRILLWTFSQKWRKREMRLPEAERHVVIQWLRSYEEWRKANQTEECREGKAWGAIPTGEVMALHQLAYDIYCLEVANKLPRLLRNRLRSRRQFQGARYEVAIAAILARAGFDITFLDEAEKSKRHCEFIAKYKYTGEQIGVEAKSRHRKGVLHEKGSYDAKKDVRGDVLHLFQRALDQKPKGLPYVIFIDLNLAPTPHLPGETKPWFKDIKAIADRWIIPSRFNALILTNFAYYYAGNEGPTPPAEFLFITPHFPEVAIESDKILSEIEKSLNRYAYIPREL